MFTMLNDIQRKNYSHEEVVHLKLLKALLQDMYVRSAVPDYVLSQHSQFQGCPQDKGTIISGESS